MITSDHGGFAVVQPLAKHSPPANIRSPELSYRAQSCSPLSAPLIGADDYLRAAGLPPEKKIQTIITSDHDGFAGVGASENEPSSAKAFSSEVTHLRKCLLLQGALSSELAALARHRACLHFYQQAPEKTAFFYQQALLQR